MDSIPGVRFVPSDEELITFYLQRRVMGEEVPGSSVIERNVYGDAPWNVFGAGDPWVTLETTDASGRKKLKSNIYAITALKKMSKARVVRTAGCGTWHGENKAEMIRDGFDRVIGSKKRLVFEAKGQAAAGNGHWIMQEYALSHLLPCGKQPTTADDHYVLCKITRDGCKPLKRSRRHGDDDRECDEQPRRKMMCFDAPFVLLQQCGGGGINNATTNATPLPSVTTLVPRMTSFSHDSPSRFAPPVTSGPVMPFSFHDLPLTFTSLVTSVPRIPSPLPHLPIAFAPVPVTSVPTMPFPSHDMPLTFTPPVTSSPTKPSPLPALPLAFAPPLNSVSTVSSLSHDLSLAPQMTSAPTRPSPSHDLPLAFIPPVASVPTVASTSEAPLTSPSVTVMPSTSNGEAVRDNAATDAVQFYQDLSTEDSWLDKLVFDYEVDGFGYDIQRLPIHWYKPELPLTSPSVTVMPSTSNGEAIRNSAATDDVQFSQYLSTEDSFVG